VINSCDSQVRGKTHRTPSPVFIIVYWSLDPPSEFLEPIEHCQLKEHIDAEDDVFRFFRISLSGEEEMIEEVSGHEDGEIKGWKLRGGGDEIDKIDQLSVVSGTSKGGTDVVVNVGDTTHDEERS